MEQINNMVAMTPQTVQAKPQIKSDGKGEPSFRKLLSKYCSPEEEAPAEVPAQLMQADIALMLPQTEPETEQPEELLAVAVSAVYMPVEQVIVETPQTLPTELRIVQPEHPVGSEKSVVTDFIAPEPSQQIETEAEPLGNGIQLTPETEVAEKFVQKVELTRENPTVQVKTADEQEELPDVADDGGVLFREVKDFMVKVGEAKPVEMPEPVEVEVKDQLGQKVFEAIENGETRLTVQLSPENLGRVDVELTLTEDGVLKLELRTENHMTQRLLEKETAGLHQMLVRNTQQDVQIQVTRQEDSRHQAFEDGRQGGNHQNPQQERREEQRNTGDFMQQLRLGLIPLDVEAS